MRSLVSKRVFIFGGCVLLLLVLVLVWRIKKPEYVTLAIPMPQTYPRYAEDYAMQEEFSTRVSDELFDGKTLKGWKISPIC